jgi:hypothetical protein
MSAIGSDRVFKDEEANLAFDLLLNLWPDNVKDGGQVAIEDRGRDWIMDTLRRSAFFITR